MARFRRFRIKAMKRSIRSFIRRSWYKVLGWVIGAQEQYFVSQRKRMARTRRRLSFYELEPLPTPRETQDTESTYLMAADDSVTGQPHDFENVQRPNPFSKLPLEIRIMIWEQCAQDCQDLHIEPLREDSRLGIPGWSYRISPRTKRSEYHRMTPQDSKGFMSLPFTCRQLYSETINLLYKCPTFNFGHPGDIVGLQKSCLTHRWKCITKVSLRFDFTYSGSQPRNLVGGYPWSICFTESEWLETCRTIASLPNLHYLRIHLALELGHRWRLEQALDPLMQITQVRDFEVRSVQYPWGKCRLEDYENAPFKLLFWSGQPRDYRPRQFTPPYKLQY